jgi:hypothetical protein
MRDFRYWTGRPVVYRVYDANGRLIYVGQSINLHTRASEHRGQSWWWKPLAHRMRIELHPTQDSAKAAEKVAIQEETPVFNSMGYGNWREKPYWSQADHDLYREWFTAWINATETDETRREQMIAAHFPEEARRRLWAVPA